MVKFEEHKCFDNYVLYEIEILLCKSIKQLGIDRFSLLSYMFIIIYGS